MARSATVLQLRTRAAERANRSDVSDTSFVTKTELIGYLNASYTELHDLLVSAGLGFFESSQTITSTGVSTGLYTLPTDYYGTLAVDYLSSTNTYLPLERYGIHDRLRANGESPGQSRGYRIAGANIQFYPAPSTGQVYRHLYVPVAGTLDDDADTVDGVNGWEEFLVVDAAMKILVKEDSNVEALFREREMIRARIEDHRQNRESAQSRCIVDVSSVNSRLEGDWP